ncbi:hypothetical protein [Leucobacter sp. GX24907]
MSPESAPTGRALLRALIAAAALVALGSIFFGTWLSLSAGEDKNGAFNFSVAYAAPLDAEPGVGPLDPEIETTQFYDDIIVASHEPLVLPRTLASIATAIPFVIVLLGCISTIVLASRLLSARPFGRAALVMLALLGLASAATAIAVPWLESRVGVLAARELHLPTDGGMVADPEADAWVVPTGFDPLQDMLWPLFTLGVALLLVAALWRHAVRLQRDTEGLV